MKQIIIIILLVLPFSLSSQSSNVKIKLGTGIPLGKYGSTDDEEAAYAKTGFELDFSGERKFNDYIGIKGSFLYNHNTIDDEMIFSKLIGLNSSVRSVETGSYAVTSFLLGFVASLSNRSIFSIDFYGMIGYSNVTDPGSRIETYSFLSGDYKSVLTDKAHANSFGYNFGTDINLEVSKSVALVLGISYFGAKANYKDVNVTITDNKYVTTGTVDYANTISILNVGLGIKIFLWNLKDYQQKGS